MIFKNLRKFKVCSDYFNLVCLNGINSLERQELPKEMVFTIDCDFPYILTETYMVFHLNSLWDAQSTDGLLIDNPPYQTRVLEELVVTRDDIDSFVEKVGEFHKVIEKYEKYKEKNNKDNLDIKIFACPQGITLHPGSHIKSFPENTPFIACIRNSDTFKIFSNLDTNQIYESNRDIGISFCYQSRPPLSFHRYNICTEIFRRRIFGEDETIDDSDIIKKQSKESDPEILAEIRDIKSTLAEMLKEDK